MKERLEYCEELMNQVNRVQGYDIFSEIELKEAEGGYELNFDLSRDSLEDLSKILSLLNLTSQVGKYSISMKMGGR